MQIAHSVLIFQGPKDALLSGENSKGSLISLGGFYRAGKGQFGVQV